MTDINFDENTLNSFFFSERSKMEIDLVVQKRLKPNSTEIETLLMEPNEAFWRFASEIQPSDITSSCFHPHDVQ